MATTGTTNPGPNSELEKEPVYADEKGEHGNRMIHPDLHDGGPPDPDAFLTEEERARIVRSKQCGARQCR
jgi:hypothetical protein